MIKVLEHLGCKVTYNKDQTCCGAFLLNAGAIDESRDLGIKFLSEFHGKEPIIIPSGGCTGMIRNRYKLLFDTSSYRQDYKVTRKRVFEFTEYITDVLKLSAFPNSEYFVNAIYHHGCKSLRECGIDEGPLHLLKSVKGIKLQEFESKETCCGFGGAFCAEYKDLSDSLADQKLQEVIDKNIETVISSDLTCLYHFKRIADAKKMKMKFMHIADVLAESII